MKYFKSKKLKLGVLFIVTAMVIFGVINYSTGVNNTRITMPKANNGVLDLRNWDFKRDGMVKLDGEWEFYENKLLSPSKLNKTVISGKDYLVIPGSYGEHTYGTYRLKVLLNDMDNLYSIKVDFLQSAYKLWANNKELISVGSVGTSKRDMTPQLLPESGTFHSNSEEVYITLQVSNFYSKYGVVDTIFIGRVEQINSVQKKNLAFDLFLFGSTLMAALYNLSLYLKRRKNKAALYFSVVCIIVAVRTLFLGQRFLISIFPSFSYILSGKIMHWTFYLYIPFIVLFINSFYDEVLPKWVTKCAKLSAYVYFVIILMSPWKYYIDIVLPIEIITALFLIYMIYKISKVYISNNSSDYIMVIGLFALFLTRINDILYEFSFIITGSFAPLGTLIFIIANSYLLAERQSLAFTSMEDMSEKLKSLDNLKDEFLVVTSHELKTPLNGIIGLSEILSINSSSSLSEDERQNLELINISAKRLSNLVNDIMMFSKLKNNDISLKKERISIGMAAEVVAKFCEISADNKNVSIINLIDSCAPYVLGDDERIEQILFNLLGNAVKFTNEGTVTLAYTVNEDFMEISIEDTGIGIPKDKLQSIFNIYEQADGVSEKYGGTGLGLYISRRLVELHGGKIGAKSTVNKGSKFTFSLPLYKCKVEAKEADYEIATNEFENIEIEQSSYKKSAASLIEEIEYLKTQKRYKILIVDDDFVNQRVLERYLSSYNHLVFKASTAKESLKLLEKMNDFDLIILDMMMPDLLGYEVAAIIREKKSIFELPILIMTANSSLENLVVAFECGANDYLTKPFNKHELLARVNTLVNLKHSVEEAISLVKQITVVNKQVENLNEENRENRRQVEELLEYDKLKTEFFTNLSHELRTPLNVIISTVQLLTSLDKSKTLGEDKIKYYLSIMNQNSLRLLRLINNIIDMTKLDGNYLTLNLTNNNIVYVVEDICQSVAEYIKNQNIDIVFDTDVEEKIMTFDEEKLERIILNILSNAVKFTNSNGSIFVNIYDKEAFIEISIRDTGVGIPKDKLEFIFERFAQLDKSLSRRSEGSGIGLSLVKSLVEMHEGKIIARSELEKGTEIIISLPVKLIEDEQLRNNVIYKQVKDSKYEKTIPMEFSDIYM